jgi:hypothetical protein
MKTSPLKAVTENFGDKQKLVSALEKLITDELWLNRVNDVKGLARVSNKKLLHLHETLTRLKKDFGSRTKLIDSILSLMKRQKDEGLRGRLQAFPTPRLLDLHTSTARRAKSSDKDDKAAKAKTPAKKRKPRSKVAKAKAASGEKKAAKPKAAKKTRTKAAP